MSDAESTGEHESLYDDLEEGEIEIENKNEDIDENKDHSLWADAEPDDNQVKSSKKRKKSKKQIKSKRSRSRNRKRNRDQSRSRSRSSHNRSHHHRYHHKSPYRGKNHQNRRNVQPRAAWTPPPLALHQELMNRIGVLEAMLRNTTEIVVTMNQQLHKLEFYPKPVQRQIPKENYNINNGDYVPFKKDTEQWY